LTVGLRLAGLDVQAGHRHPCGVGLKIAAVRTELVGVHQPRRLDPLPRNDGNAAAALDMRFGRRQVPPVGQHRRQRRRELIVVGPGLLQAHDVGRGGGEPRQQAEVLR